MSTRRPHPSIDPALRARLSVACERVGLPTAARAAGVNPYTLAAALAGAPVVPATARVLALAADELERNGANVSAA